MVYYMELDEIKKRLTDAYDSKNAAFFSKISPDLPIYGASECHHAPSDPGHGTQGGRKGFYGDH